MEASIAPPHGHHPRPGATPMKELSAPVLTGLPAQDQVNVLVGQLPPRVVCRKVVPYEVTVGQGTQREGGLTSPDTSSCNTKLRLGCCSGRCS